MTEQAVRILLVEDNPGDARLLAEIVRESGQGRFDMTHVDSLEGAVARLREGLLDIVLLDLALPDSRGLATFDRVREAAPEVPIIVLTGLDDERTAAEALRRGAQDYLPKGGIDGPLIVRAIRYAMERRRADDEREKLLEQLRHSQKIEAVGRLAGGIAHDFNNMMQVVTGYAERTLRSLGPQDPLRRNIEEIRNAGVRSAALTRQLLAFGRKQIMRPERLDPNRVVAGFMQMLDRTLGEDVRLVAEFDPGVGQIEADPYQIEQVLMNLALNARHAMPKGGVMVFSTGRTHIDSPPNCCPDARPGDYVVIGVKDTGKGMTKDVLARLFEPFFTTKRPGEGSGLGLSTAYGIVAQSGGFIEVESEPGKGSKFDVYLPRVYEEGELRRLILLVGDKSSPLGRIAEELRTSGGYRVIVTIDALEVMQLSKRLQGAIDLLVVMAAPEGMSAEDLITEARRIRPDMNILSPGAGVDKDGHTIAKMIEEWLSVA